MAEIKPLYTPDNNSNDLDVIRKIRIKNGLPHEFRCETCDFYVPETEIDEGKCKISRQYDGTVEGKVGRWISNLGCASHSSFTVPFKMLEKKLLDLKTQIEQKHHSGTRIPNGEIGEIIGLLDALVEIKKINDGESYDPYP